MFLMTNAGSFTFKIDYSLSSVSIMSGTSTYGVYLLDTDDLLGEPFKVVGEPKNIIFTYYFLKHNEKSFCGEMTISSKLGEYTEVTLDSKYYETDVINVLGKSLKVVIWDGVLYFATNDFAYKYEDEGITSRDKLSILYLNLSHDVLQFETRIEDNNYSFYVSKSNSNNPVFLARKDFDTSRLRVLEKCGVNEALFG